MRVYSPRLPTMRVIGSQTISTSRPRSFALFRSVVGIVAMSSSQSTQVGHLLRQNRILAARADAGRVARRRSAALPLGMPVFADVVAPRLHALPEPHLVAAPRHALARVLGMTLAANRDAVVCHAIG